MQDFYIYKGIRENSGNPQRKRKVFGVGSNDVDYNVYEYGVVGNKKKAVWVDPYYRVWKKMLERVHCGKCHSRQPTYEGLRIHKPWYSLKEFRDWMSQQNWRNKELDKDLLGDGKLYSPDTCCFVLDLTNNFLREPRFEGRTLPIGVRQCKKSGRYRATIGDFQYGGTRHLGTFDTIEEAHLAWLARKRYLATILSSMEDDARVKEALLKKYTEDNYSQKVSA